MNAASWRDALLRALAANGVSLDTVGETYVREGAPVPAWLDELTSGTGTEPTAARYLALADLTGIELEVLTGAISPEATLSVAMRSRGQTAPNEVLIRATRLLRAAARVMRLDPVRRNRLLGAQRAARPDPDAADHPTRRSGTQAALRFRAANRIGVEPILDLVDLIENHGVAVEFSSHLPRGLHGVTGWSLGVGGWTAVMLVNAEDLWTVQRYTLAHEFCHVLFEDRPEDLTTELEDQIGSDPAEQRAESFASALLLPTGGIRRFWTAERLDLAQREIAVARVMWQFGASRLATCIALENCAQIDWTERDTRAVGRLSVPETIARAGLRDEWEGVETDHGGPAPSAWLASATADLFYSGSLPIENYAVATGLPAEDALSSLVGADI